MPRVAHHDPSQEVTELFERAVALRGRHEIVPARVIVVRLLGRLRRGGAGPLDIARVLQLRASLDGAAGRTSLALRTHVRAVALLEPLRRDHDAVRLRVQGQCAAAWMHIERGEYAEARVIYRGALGLARRRLGPDDADTVIALNGLGVVGKYTGQFQRAASYYQRALAALARRDDADLNMLATLHHNLGGLEHARGRPERGEPHARRSVELRQQLLGPDHPAVAADLAALAALLDAQDSFAEAETLYRRALVIFRRYYGSEHYELAVSYNNLGALAHRRGRLRQAERLYLRALAMKRRLLHEAHPDVAMTLSNLGVLYAESGRVGEAIRAYRQALAIFRRSFPDRHPSIRLCLAAQAALDADERTTGTRGARRPRRR